MRKSAKYFLNNNGKKLLAASVMALLLSVSAQPGAGCKRKNFRRYGQ